MTIFSYHASHEQFSPSALLYWTKAAEKAGFDACHSSDHFHPWSVRQGQSGYSFSWLGAAMQATSFPFSLITAPGQRYHPAIVAQAIATLAQMFPSRLEVALGSGEALNEAITGEVWPEKKDRHERLLECESIIRRLLKGETVTHRGLVNVEQATLFTRPDVIPKLMAAALTEETAHWAGSWADGLLIGHQSLEGTRSIITAFRKGGGINKPIHVQVTFSYARSMSDAISGAHDQWRSNMAGMEALASFTRPEQFDEATHKLTEEDVKKNILIESDLNVYIKTLSECAALGVENIILHNVNRKQDEFIADFGKVVLPTLKQQKINSYSLS